VASKKKRGFIYLRLIKFVSGDQHVFQSYSLTDRTKNPTYIRKGQWFALSNVLFKGNMMFVFVKSVLFYLAVTLSIASYAYCSEPLQDLTGPLFASGAPTRAVKKLNDHLYVAQHVSGEWFAAERLVDEGPRLQFWKDWAQQEENIHHDEYKQLWSRGSLPKGKGYPMFLGRDHSLTTGLYSFRRVLSNISHIDELWVVFACQNEIGKVEDIAADQIEIAVTLSTDRAAPMVTQMGISRSFQYLLKALRSYDVNEYIIHKNLSSQLLSFAAAMMLTEHPEKLYMITTPVEVMRNLMLKAFPNRAFEGDNVQKATKGYWQALNDDKVTQTMLSNQIRTNIGKTIQERDELNYRIRVLKELKHPSNEKEIDALTLTYQDVKARVKDLIAQEEMQDAKSIQEISETTPFDKLVSPIRRTLLPEDITQIYNLDRTQVIYEYNKTRNIVTIGRLVLTGDATTRFKWFNGGDMRFRDNLNPYVTIALSDLAHKGE
jgi:hypothetical protein